MALDPSDAELQAMNEVLKVALHLKIDGDPTDPKTTLGSLFALFGAKPDSLPAVIGIFPEPVYMQIIKDKWKVPDPAPATTSRDPTLVENGQALVFGHICRLIAGTVKTQRQAQKEANEAAQLAADRAKAAVAASPVGGKKKIKFEHHVGQATDEDCDEITAKHFEGANANYHKTFKSDPPPRKECTLAQLSAFFAILTLGLTLYIDFAVWTPFAIRTSRRIKLRSTVMHNGMSTPIEIWGPPNFESWYESYELFITACISFETISLGVLLRYMEKVRSFRSKYGRPAWALIYQSETRMRSEQSGRIRRKGERERTKALAAGGTHDFDPKKPWEWVWDQMILDAEWWKTELEDPGDSFKFGAVPLTEHLAGDAPVDRPSGGKGGDALQHMQASQESNIVAHGYGSQSGTGRVDGVGGYEVSPGGGGRGNKRRGRDHTLGDDGLYTHNRQGNLLCDSFRRTGACEAPLVGIAKARCASGSHQCGKCLGTGHGASSCTRDLPPAESKRARFNV